MKFSEVNFSDMLIFEKNVRSFCSAKALFFFFSTKNFSVFGCKVVKHLTSLLTSSLS